jgi:MerR family transcriptional regulator, copper efflux regulator
MENGLSAHSAHLTIGQLARRLGLRPSALRFYEAEGLLTPAAHSAAGYRLYDTTAETTLRFIQRAQRIGFALTDIRTLLAAQRAGTFTDDTVLALADARYQSLERQLTPLLVQQHELGLFLNELRAQAATTDQPTITPAFDQLLEHVCGQPLHQPAAGVLDRLLIDRACALQSRDGHTLLAALRGLHVHIWTERETYQILLIGAGEAQRAALERLITIEADCGVHPALLTLTPNVEGLLLNAPGPHGYLFARLFLALEHE